MFTADYGDEIKKCSYFFNKKRIPLSTVLLNKRGSKKICDVNIRCLYGMQYCTKKRKRFEAECF